MAYHEVTPTDELTAEVQYLDGNTDTPSDADIQLRYLDGNVQTFTSHKQLLKMGSYYIVSRAARTYIPIRSALNPVINIATGLQEAIIMYMDGNKEFYTPTDYRWYSGESCDGNIPSIPVRLFNEELNWHDNDKTTVIAGDKYDWYKESNLLVLRGYPTFIKGRKDQLILQSNSFFDKTVENHRGVTKPETMVHVDDEYKGYVSKLSLTKISGQLDKAYRYSGNNHYTYAPSDSLLVVASPYDDGTGQIYDEDGIVIGRTRDYASIFYDPYVKNDLTVHREPKWTEDLNTYATPDEFSVVGELNYPYKINLNDSAVFFALIKLHAGRQKLDVSTEELVSIYYRSSSESIGTHLTHGYRFIYSNSSFVEDPNGIYEQNPSAITIDALEGSEVIIRTKKVVETMQINISPKLGSSYNYTNVRIPKYYLFDYGIMKNIPKVYGNTIQLDHMEYRLKGPIFFPNEGVAKWCVLEYQKPKTYKIVKTVEILDFKKLVNQELFVAVETNPYTTL